MSDSTTIPVHTPPDPRHTIKRGWVSVTSARSSDDADIDVGIEINSSEPSRIEILGATTSKGQIVIRLRVVK